MKKIFYSLFIAATLCSAGFAAVNSSRNNVVPGTSLTNSNPTLAKEAKSLIYKPISAQVQGCQNISITDTKIVGSPSGKKTANEQISTAIWEESWVVRACSKTFDVPIKFDVNFNSDGSKDKASVSVDYISERYKNSETIPGYTFTKVYGRPSEIRALVYKNVGAKAPNCPIMSVIDTKILKTPYDLIYINGNTVGGKWEEVWTVKACSKIYDVPITLIYDEKNGSSCNIQTENISEK